MIWDIFTLAWWKGGNSQSQGCKSDTNAALHDFLTAGAPEDVAAVVLQQAGLRMRLVSRTYNGLHPPLLALTPNLTTTAADLPAHLAALPSTLTSLDLRGLLSEEGQENQDQLISQAALSAIATHLPRLQQLTLPSASTSLAPALLTTLQACPALHTINAGLTASHGHQPNWTPLLDPPLATRLRSLSNLHCEAAFCAAPPLSLPNLTSLHPSDDRLPAIPSPLRQLATLCAAAPALRALDLDLAPRTCQDADAVRVLTALTALTDLTLHFSTCCSDDNQLLDHPTSSLLQHLGMLTTLRSLSLITSHNGWTPPEAGWLQRLTQLTSLEITFCFEFVFDWDDEGDITFEVSPAAAATFTPEVGPVISEVATNAACLPLLHKLEVEFTILADDALCCEAWLQCRTPDSFFRHLAAATQLRHLCLRNLPLPPPDASLLTRLQRLSALQLQGCFIFKDPQRRGGYHPGPRTLAWVAAFPCLRHLSLWQLQGSLKAAPTCLAVGSLAMNLHTLDVDVQHGSVLGCPLEQLLEAAAGQLERLELSGDVGKCRRAGVQLVHYQLQQLTCLRVLDLRHVTCSRPVKCRRRLSGLLRQLRLPPSVRHCYLPTGIKPGNAAVQGLQAAYPLVAFRCHCRLDRDVW